MRELGIVPNGALLIRNGVIAEVGPARRVENLAGARNAREIDATGKIVMPAFVDADMALVAPAAYARCGEADDSDDGGALRLTSRKKVHTQAALLAAEWARYGCLSVGAHTGHALDLQNIRKVLRAHQTLQSKPLRIRSIFSPQIPAENGGNQAAMFEALESKWLHGLHGRKLASVVEFTVAGPDQGSNAALTRAAAITAASLGYAIRLRSSIPLEPVHLQFALSAGAIAIVAPMDSLRGFYTPLASGGCVRVIPTSEAFNETARAALTIRKAIDQDVAVALASSYRPREPSSFNFQFILYLAVYRLGLTPEEAIVATIWNPACSLRLSHVAGSLEPGKAADLVMMDVPDYHELARRAGHHDVSLVLRAGQPVFRNSPLTID
jgi:imidazolonepropionase